MPDDQETAQSRCAPCPGPLWWFGQVLFTGIACFFVWFGICLLLAAYRLNDPYSFIMTFFAASLMTLISAVMALGFVVRMRMAGRSDGSGDDRETDFQNSVEDHTDIGKESILEE